MPPISGGSTTEFHLKVDFKIGFDLTRDLNGKPALTVRRYDDNSKSTHEIDVVSKPSIRADSFSDSDENDKARLDARQKDKSESKESDEEDSGNGNLHILH
ncbi:unnamed protein product [Parnassius apollo]|uniref:(apollo) hypothetical protein n=1 Tax=Parnassius apollo TaxID=110799 RepID=A0A8S3WN97_PARAO|nr:unnamed protein product [Parnassius apollo]